MPENVCLPLGVPYNVVMKIYDGNLENTFSSDGMTLRNVRVVSDGGGNARYELLFSRVAWKPTPVKPRPLDCMVRIKDQPTGLFGPVLAGWKDMTVRRMALKLAEEVKILPEAVPFVAEDKRSYRVLTIAKVTEEKAVQGVYVPKRGDTETKLGTKLVTTKRFHFRDRWYNSPDGDELSFRCSSYKALLGKDLSTMLPRSDYRLVVRMVLPKSTGSPLGALLVELIKK